MAVSIWGPTAARSASRWMPRPEEDEDPRPRVGRANLPKAGLEAVTPSGMPTRMSQPTADDGGGGWGDGLGLLIGGITKPLDLLSRGLRGVTLGLEEFATELPEWAEWAPAATGFGLPLSLASALVDEERAEADDRSNWEKFNDPNYGAGQIFHQIDTGNDTFDKWANRGVGLAGDIALDPLTYATLGAGSLVGAAGRTRGATKLLNAQRVAAEAGDVGTLAKLAAVADGSATKLDDLTTAGLAEVQRVATRGPSVANAAQREAMGLGRQGLYLGSSKSNVRVPFTGGLGRVVGEGLATGRAAARKLPGAQGLRNIRSPRGLEEATTQIATGQGSIGIERALDMVQASDLMRRGSQGFSEEMARAVNDAKKELADPVATTAAEEFGRNSVINDLMRMARETAEKYGSNIPELADAAADTYVPHVLNRQFRDFLRGNVDAEGRWLSATGMATDDLLEESRFVQRRHLRPNADGTPNTITFKSPGIGERTIEIRTGKIEELNSILRSAFPEYRGKFYETDPQIIMESYVDSLARQVGRDYAASEMVKRSPHFARAVADEGQEVVGSYLDEVLEAIPDTAKTKAANKTLATEQRAAANRIRSDIKTTTGEGEELISQARSTVRGDLAPVVRARGTGRNPGPGMRSLMVEGTQAKATYRQVRDQIRGASREARQRVDRFDNRMKQLSNAKSGAKRKGRVATARHIDNVLDELDEAVAIKNQIDQNVKAIADQYGDTAELREEVARLQGLFDNSRLGREIADVQRQIDSIGDPLDPLWHPLTPDERSQLTEARNLVRQSEAQQRGELGGRKIGMKRVAAAQQTIDSLGGRVQTAVKAGAKEVGPLQSRLQRLKDLARLEPEPGNLQRNSIYDQLEELGRSDQRVTRAQNQAMKGLADIEGTVATKAAQVERIVGGTDPGVGDIAARTAREVGAAENQRLNAKLVEQGARQDHAATMTRLDAETTRVMEEMDRIEGDRLALINQAEEARAILAKMGEQRRVTNPAGLEKAAADLDEVAPYLDDPVMATVGSLLANVQDNILSNRLDQRALAVAEENLRKAKKNELHTVYTSVLRDGWSALRNGPVKAGDVVVDSELARRFQNLYRVTEDPKMLGRTLTAYTNFFKTYATLTPGFHVRNAMSAVFMNSSDGVSLPSQMKGLRIWRRYVEGGPEWLEKQPEHIRAAFEATFASGSGGRFFESGVAAGPLANTASERLFRNRATKASQRVGQDWVEGPVRLAMALDSISAKVPAERMAEAIDDALARITRIHFDYSQVSTFDEKARRLIPFWTFMSRNLPMQITQMWTKPRLYAQYNSFVRNFSDPDEEFTPGYFSEIGAFRISLLDPLIPGDAPIYLQPDFAHTRVTDDVDMITQFLSGENRTRPLTNLNPFFTAPIEYLGGNDFFTGQQFGPTDVVAPEGAVNEAMLPLYTLLGMTKKGPDGRRVIEEKGINAMRAINPLLDRTARLIPQSVGEGGDPQRQLEAIARTAGLPIRQLSEKQQESTRRAQQFDRRDELAMQAAMRRALAGG